MWPVCGARCGRDECDEAFVSVWPPFEADVTTSTSPPFQLSPQPPRPRPSPCCRTSHALSIFWLDHHYISLYHTTPLNHVIPYSLHLHDPRARGDYRQRTYSSQEYAPARSVWARRKPQNSSRNQPHVASGECWFPRRLSRQACHALPPLPRHPFSAR